MTPNKRMAHAVARVAKAETKFVKAMLSLAAFDKLMDEAKTQWEEQRIALASASESAV